MELNQRIYNTGISYFSAKDARFLNMTWCRRCEVQHKNLILWLRGMNQNITHPKTGGKGVH